MKLTKAMKDVMKKMGSIGGRSTAARMTPKQRQERARKAGIASGKARARKAGSE